MTGTVVIVIFVGIRFPVDTGTGVDIDVDVVVVTVVEGSDCAGVPMIHRINNSLFGRRLLYDTV